MAKKTFYFILSCIIICFSSCSKGKNIPDVSHISVDLTAKRFEKDLFNIDTTHITQSIEKLYNQYPDLAPIVLDQILKSKDPRYAPLGQETYIKGFISHPSLQNLYQEVQNEYPNIDPIKSDIVQALKYYKYYFPKDIVPKNISTFISEYTLAGFIYKDNQLAIGLDMYLGADYPYQKYNPNNEAFSHYLTRSFNKDHIISQTITVLIEDKLGTPNHSKLIDYMIHNGKKLYILEAILPQQPDSIIFNQSQKNTKWLYQNEHQLYAYLIDRDLFYSTNFAAYNKLINPSPVGNTDMPQETPGQAANFIGRQIIHSFMKHNPNTTLQQLIDQKDAQYILNKSKYRPAKK